MEEELWRDFKELKMESQRKYLEYRESNDPAYSKLNMEIEAVFQSKRKQKISRLYEYFYENGLVDKKIKELEDKMNNLKKNHRKEGKTMYYWITINPPDEIKLEDLLLATNKLINRAMIEEYMYVVEQRGAIVEELGKGKHIHLYYKIKEDSYEPPSKIIKYLKSTYKKVVNVETKALWIQPLKEEYKKDKINYMLEKNKDGEHEDKERKSEMDKIYREDNNLDNYYTNIPQEDLYKMISANVDK